MQQLEVKVADIIAGDIIDVSDELPRGPRWETVDGVMVVGDTHRLVFLKGVGFPIALIADDDRTVTVLRHQ